jgi:hypothetical protein
MCEKESFSVHHTVLRVFPAGDLPPRQINFAELDWWHNRGSQPKVAHYVQPLQYEGIALKVP